MSAHGFKAGDLVEYHDAYANSRGWKPGIVVRISDKSVWVGSEKFPDWPPNRFGLRKGGTDWFHRNSSNLRLRQGVMR